MNPLKRALLSRTTLANATAGSLSAITAMTLLYPLEKARVVIQAGGNNNNNSLIQAILSIYQEHGLVGLYGGLRSNLVSLGASNFVYFYWNNFLKSLAQSLRPQLERNEELKAGWSLLIAFLAGCINVFMTTPLWVATTRMALQSGPIEKRKYQSLWHALITIYQEEGTQGLFAGLGPSLVLVTNPTIQYVSFEKMKSAVIEQLHGRQVNADAMFVLDDLDRMNTNANTTAAAAAVAITSPSTTTSQNEVEETIEFVKQSASHLNATEAFIIGGLSKFMATLLTYPFQVAQTRLRAQQQAISLSPRNLTMNNDGSFKDDDSNNQQQQQQNRRTLLRHDSTIVRAMQSSGIVQTFAFLLEMLQNEGISSWFKGFTAKLTQTVLNTAVMFVIYEKLSAWVFYFLLRRKLQRSAA
jgi:hypothetical protein